MIGDKAAFIAALGLTSASASLNANVFASDVVLTVGDSRPWHQFAKVEEPDKVWTEVLTSDLVLIEESVDPDATVVDNNRRYMQVMSKHVPRTLRPHGLTAEQAEWNKAVDAKRAEKRRTKLLREIKNNITPGGAS